MRTLKRNERIFAYCQFVSKNPVLSPDGYDTGDYQISYSAPVEIHGNISAAQGESQVEQFGNDLKYDKVIVIEDPNCPVDENSVLFVDKAYCVDDKGNPVYDYIVRRVARSLNSVSYAISKVEIR